MQHKPSWKERHIGVFFNHLYSPTCPAPVSCESICKSSFVFSKSRLRSCIGNLKCNHWKRRSLKHFRGVQFRSWGKTWSPVKSTASWPLSSIQFHTSDTLILFPFTSDFPRTKHRRKALPAPGTFYNNQAGREWNKRVFSVWEVQTLFLN